MSTYTRELLQEMGRDYADAVINNETNIFTKYIGQGILKHAALGEKKIYFPIANYSGPIQRLSNGNLNRYDPGPIPRVYLPDVIRKLQVFFPDTEFMPGDDFLWVNWS
jgi:hypothetical protein